MPAVLAKRIAYTRAEYISDLVVHVMGIVAVTAAVPVLIALAILLDGSSSQIAAASVYGFGFAAMISCSALYNIFPHPEWEWLFKRLDHSAIYLKIAGTYTGLSLASGSGHILVPAVWAVAGLGVALKLVSPHRYRWAALSLYIGLGTLSGVFIELLMPGLPETAFSLLSIAGILYLVGVVFYLWDRLPYHFTIWHVFVLVACLLVYCAMLSAVLA